MPEEKEMMLDFNQEPELPDFEVKLGDTVYKFDPLVLDYNIVLENEKDPAKVAKVVNDATGLNLTAAQSIQFVRKLVQFLAAHEEIVKNVYGRSSSSTSASESATQSTEASPAE